MAQHEELRALVRAYRTGGGGPLPASRAARLVELAAAVADEVARLKVQLEIMSLEVEAHESISAEIAGTAARHARLGLEDNPHHDSLEAPPGETLHDHWALGWHASERILELELRCRDLEAELAALRGGPEAAPDRG